MSASRQLSENADIFVLTCGPGEELYSVFGHTAIWVSDSTNNIDEVFNYGTFDMDTPNFYFRFVGGRLDYSLSVSDFDGFMYEYVADQRWVYLQSLLCSHSIKQQLYDSLRIVMRPENRNYRYRFFGNNCSTKVLDLILHFEADSRTLDSLNLDSGKSYRKALKPCMRGHEWLGLGMNTMLGPYSDKPITRRQSAFIPKNLMQQIAKVGIATEQQTIFEGRAEGSRTASADFPMIFFWVLMLLIVSEALWLKTSQRFSNWVDVILFGLAGLVGLVFVFLWNWSDHLSLQVNLNLFWANPLNLLVIWSILWNRKKITQAYLIFYALLLFFLLVSWSKFPQTLPLELMPVVAALVFRAVNRVFKFKQKDKILASKETQ